MLPKILLISMQTEKYFFFLHSKRVIRTNRKNHGRTSPGEYTGNCAEKCLESEGDAGTVQDLVPSKMAYWPTPDTLSTVFLRRS